MQHNEYDISAAFQKIEEELIASMIRNMDRHRAEETAKGYEWSMWQTEQLKALEKYKKNNQKKYKKQFNELNRQIRDLIREARNKGGMKQEIQILQAIKKGWKVSGKNKAPERHKMTAEFFRINDRKLNALIEATVHDMEKAETAILRKANDDYRKAIFDAQVYANSGAGTYEKAVDMATKDMLSRGLNCVEYSNGARHTLPDYADMAIRTANKRAYLQGEGEKRQEWGIHTVIMAKRGNPCPKCLPFVGKILIDDVWSGGSGSENKGADPETGKKYPLMSYAISKGLYHPRCKDSHTTYFPGISSADDTWTQKELEDIGLQNQQEAKRQYAERQEKKYTRLAKNSLDEKSKNAYREKAGRWKIQKDNLEQEYKPVNRVGAGERIMVKRDIYATIRKVDSYDGKVYISDKASIKPRALHDIYMNTIKALDLWKIPRERMPKIIIVAVSELEAYGKYVAYDNILYFIPEVVKPEISEGSAITEYHELWHMKQAERFRDKGWNFIRDNHTKYIEALSKDCKKRIDAFGITEYNVEDISKYAKDNYEAERYDEVEAEYMTRVKRKQNDHDNKISRRNSEIN